MRGVFKYFLIGSSLLFSLAFSMIIASHLVGLNEVLRTIIFLVLLFLAFVFTKSSLFFCFKILQLMIGEGAFSIGSLLYRKSFYSSSFFCFKVACFNEIIEGCCLKAYMYSTGEGVDQDLYLARSLYRKACDKGDSTSCNNLGYLFENGFGVRRDKELAVKYYSKACRLGDEEGCDNYIRIQKIIGPE